MINQSFPDWELIIVDDGSTDGSYTISTSFLNDFRITTLTQQNAGPGAARNKGLTQAKGAFCAFLDADDEWLPDFLEQVLKIFKTSPHQCASVTTAFYKYPKGESMKSKCIRARIPEGAFRLDPQMDAKIAAMCLGFMSPCTTVIRRTVIERYNGFFDGYQCLYGEDAYLMLKILLNETVYFHFEPHVNVHTEAGNLSKKRSSSFPIPAYLARPDDIRKRCPKRLLPLLEQIFSLKATQYAQHLKKKGKRSEAAHFLQGFPQASLDLRPNASLNACRFLTKLAYLFQNSR